MGTTVVQYNAPLLQSSSSDAVRDHVRVQFATVCSRRADVRNSTSYVHNVSSRISDWTSSYAGIFDRIIKISCSTQLVPGTFERQQGRTARRRAARRCSSRHTAVTFTGRPQQDILRSVLTHRRQGYSPSGSWIPFLSERDADSTDDVLPPCTKGLRRHLQELTQVF